LETVEQIHKNMLGNISNEYDKSRGSFFYDATKPVAIELEKSYIEQDETIKRGFVETSYNIYLDRKVAEQGIARKPPTKATTIVEITGAPGTQISVGSRVASDTVTFIVKENKIIGVDGKVNILVECEQFGSIGNVPQGIIRFFPVTIAGLTSVTNLNNVTNGYDGESDEELRQRYFDKVRTPATSGNKYHYRNWAKEITGVGDARIFPLWNGNGTVKVVVLNSNKRGADNELITNVFNYIEENRPIGATVTVVSANEITVNVNVNLVIDENNYNVNQVLVYIEENIIEYLKEIAFTEDYVSYAKIGSIILSSQGVLDYSNLLLNNTTGNIAIDNESVAVLGGVIVG